MVDHVRPTTRNTSPDIRRPRGDWRALGAGLVAALASAMLTAGMSVVVPAGPAGAATTTLAQLAATRDKQIGVALAPDRLTDPAYRNIADSEFDHVVAEDAMTWAATESLRGSFTWSAADEIATYAATSGKALTGHALVSPTQVPAWVDEITSTDDLRAALREHISAVVGRYGDQVEYWNVLDEVFAEDGNWREDSVFQRLDNFYWMEEALYAARAAAPNAKLCVNDHGTEAIRSKATALYNLVLQYQARGVPIDCVGFQTHLAVNGVPDTLQENLQRFADLGIDVRITELDIRVPVPASPADLRAQATDYRRVFQACLAVTRCTGITVWGVTDRYSWIPDALPGQGAGLLWDEGYAKKPAYDGVTAALLDTTNPTFTSPPPTPSAPGPGPSPTVTSPAPPSGCTVTYRDITWNRGFIASIRIGNDTTSPVHGWTLTFSLGVGQRVSHGFNATVTQSGAQVTARNVGHNRTIGANGGAQSFGYQATQTGGNPAPTSFALNGRPCRTA
ncbi:endo-1,4-beta-xylanase [Plantactinospora soyae]|uniref:Beta-xylanase n=1 Tax=Plantactinospora soyae TaxID=1544732 RepID=A0A927M9G8_9ACTN|nr:endo-1,4-beta-xylanase [Plantactinospora soyae]MBE1490294.1 endo-1,4-beta-xylanase [Plantactinospora soyae]